MKYLIGFGIETGLSNDDVQSLDYKGLGIKLDFKTAKKICFVESEADNGHDAVTVIAPKVTESLGIISYITKAATFLKDPVIMLKSEEGLDERSLYIVTTESRVRGPKIIQPTFDSIQDLMTSIDTNSELILRWLRWSFRATTWLEKFVFLWLATEKAAGESTQYAKCSHGHDIKLCADCSAKLDKYKSVNKDEVRKILSLLPSGESLSFKDLWKLRNAVFHGRGSIELTDVYRITPLLQKALLAHLDKTLKPKFKLNIEPIQKTTIFSTHTIFTFTTRAPQEEYAVDYPSDDEINKYLKEPNGTYSFNIPSGDIDYGKW